MSPHEAERQEPIRVLYVIDSLADGGAEKSLAHFAEALIQRQVELHVAFLKPRWNVAKELESAGAALHPIGHNRSRPRQWMELVNLIRSLDPDLVHTTLWEANVLGRTAALATRTPVVTTLTSSSYGAAQLDDPAVNSVKARTAQLIDRITQRNVVVFHAVSAQVAHDMADRMKIAKDRIRVVPRARRRDTLGEPSVERYNSVRATLGVDASTRLVLAIGRHEFAKGLDVLIRAASLLSEETRPSFVIAGRSGRATADLVQLAETLEVESSIRFLGSRDDVPDLIVASDLVVVPSRVEGLPGAVLEAMALERPIVASNIPAVTEAIGEHAAALVAVGDHRSLADAISAVLDRDDQTSVIRARQRFDRRFSPGAVAQQLRVLYEDALGA